MRDLPRDRAVLKAVAERLMADRWVLRFVSDEGESYYLHSLHVSLRLSNHPERSGWSKHHRTAKPVTVIVGEEETEVELMARVLRETLLPDDRMDLDSLMYDRRFGRQRRGRAGRKLRPRSRNKHDRRKRRGG